MMGKKACFIILLLTFGFIFTPLHNCIAVTRSYTVDEYVQLLNSKDIDTRRMAAKHISKSNIADPKLFDLIEEMLIKGYNEPNDYHKHIDEMQLLCKALASSGLLKYKGTLNKVAETANDPFIKRSASNAFKNIEIIRANKEVEEEKKEQYMEEGFSSESSEYVFLLKSGDLQLIRNAAKEMYGKRFTDEKVLDLAHDVLRQEFRKIPQKTYEDEEIEVFGSTPIERMRYDAISWLCNVLGQSHQSKYRETLELIAKKAVNEKVKKYAKHNLKKIH